jgi:type I restriction enzyme, S subunit
MELRPGYQQTEVGVIPIEWRILPITEVTSAIFLGLTSTVDYVNSEGIPLIRATDIANGHLSFEQARTISLRQHRELTKYRRAKRGDVLVSKSGSLGVCAIVDVDTEFSIYESIIVLQSNSLLDSLFLLSLLRYEATQNRMIGERVGSSVGHLNLEMFRRLVIPIPPISEQRAIAAALSDADALIESLEQLIAKKHQVKQGAMQELLTGKKRLPGFGGEWGSQTLESLEKAKLLKLSRGKVISKKDIERIPGDYPIYSSSVTGNGVFGHYGDFMFDEELITWSIDGGGHFFYRPKHRFSVTNVCGFMRVDNHSLCCPFIAAQLQLLHSRLNFDYLTKAHPSVIRKAYVLKLPPLLEQAAIAATLSDMDEEIAALEDNLAKARQIKQGMMQELLTGHIRLV